MTLTEIRARRAAKYAQMLLTLTLEEIGKREGIHRERVRQIIAAAGFDVGQISRIRMASERATRIAAKRAALIASWTTCHHCGETIKRPVRADGKPRFCNKKLACRSAETSYAYHHNPNIKAYVRARAQTERAKQLQRENTRRYHLTEKGKAALVRNKERARIAYLEKKSRQLKEAA